MILFYACIEQSSFRSNATNSKLHVNFITFMLEDEHRLSLGMLMHVKYMHELYSLLTHIPTYLHLIYSLRSEKMSDKIFYKNNLTFCFLLNL
jgi:hypothetical protein